MKIIRKSRFLKDGSDWKPIIFAFNWIPRLNRGMTVVAVFIIVFLFPFLCLANTVVINEIAWMGAESSNDEWIELYNLTDQEIDLSGWTLKANDGTPEISLDKIIASQGYFLLERTDDQSAPNVSADQIYTGALSNNGEKLELYDSQNNLIDIVDCSDKWPAGNNDTKQTMERTEIGWQTSQDAGGTPKSANSLGASEDSQEPESGPTTEITFLPSTDYPPIADAGPDIIALNNQEIIFDALQSYDPDADKLNFFWNFGDGATDTKATTTHIYTIPGQYIVTLQVSDKKFSAFDNLTANIYNQSIIISEFKNEWIEIYNQSSRVANLSGWQLDNQEDESEPFTFPNNSLIAPYQFLVFKQPITKISLSNQDAIRLIYPSGQIASQINYVDIKENQSIAFDGVNYYITDIPTPGTANIISNNSPLPSSNLTEGFGQNNPKPIINESQEPQILVNNLAETEDFSALSPNPIEESNILDSPIPARPAGGKSGNDKLIIQAQNISDKVKPLSNNLLLNPQSVPKKSSANLILILSIIISASLLIGWGIVMIKKIL